MDTAFYVGQKCIELQYNLYVQIRLSLLHMFATYIVGRLEHNETMDLVYVGIQSYKAMHWSFEW